MWQAEFYQYAVYGKGLTEAQRGGGPAATGGKKAMLSGGMRSIAKEIASDELKCARAPDLCAYGTMHDIPHFER